MTSGSKFERKLDEEIKRVEQALTPQEIILPPNAQNVIIPKGMKVKRVMKFDGLKIELEREYKE